MAHAIFFYTFSAIAIISAVMVTASKNTVHSVFFLILDFISISCLFIMIGAEFLGMIMLIVYVGAVAVLFLFVVMMLNVAQQTNQWFLSSQPVISFHLFETHEYNQYTKSVLINECC
jgi:NADH-quinone oxidoreductase subunit J